MFFTPCIFNADTSGTAAFHVGSAHSPGDVPQNLRASDTKQYRYYAELGDVWEDGYGTWNQAALTLTRTTIFSNSDGTTSAINFTSYPVVYVFPPPNETLEPVNIDAVIPSGTLMLFQQSSAPTGWTKQTTHNDKALRVVSGTAGSGGTSTFSTMFTNRTGTTDGHTITVAESAYHAHNFTETGLVSNTYSLQTTYNPGSLPGDVSRTTAYVGNSDQHTHGFSISIAVQYVDLIIASKDVFVP